MDGSELSEARRQVAAAPADADRAVAIATAPADADRAVATAPASADDADRAVATAPADADRAGATAPADAACAVAIATAPADDADRAAGALLAVADALARADGRPLLIVGDARGFVLDGAPRDAAVRELLARTAVQLAEHALPTIAATAGPLLDGGLELALACDLRYAAPGAAVGLPGARAGRLPVGGGQRLQRLGGSSLASRLLLLGETPRCGEEPQLERLLALDADPEQAARAALAQLAAAAPLALEGMKAALRAAADSNLSAGLQIEADLACLLLPTADRAEGISALLERRAPRFDGR